MTLLNVGDKVKMTNLNTIFEQNGVVYAVCSHKVPPGDLAKFISNELRHIHKIPGAIMRTATTEEVRSMPFGSPVYPGQVKKNTVKQEALL